RLFAHLIEVHEGAFPVWYAPVQLVVLPVADEFDGAARDLSRKSIEAGLRCETWFEGSLGARVRRAAKRRVPYVAVVGAREAAAGVVSLRQRDGSQLDPMPIDDAIRFVQEVAASRKG